MSSEGEQMVRAIFEAFNARDTDAVIAATHPDVVWEPVSAAFLSGSEPYRGHEGIARYIADVAERWSTLQVRPTQVRSAGDAVVALGHAVARLPHGEEQSVTATWVVKFKDGLVVSGRVFADESFAREWLQDDRT